MPIIGFYDDNGNEVLLQDVANGAGVFHPARHAFAMAIAQWEIDSQAYRSSRDIEISVSEIASPLRSLLLQRRNEYFVDYKRLVAMWHGSLMHDALAQANNAMTEQTFTVEIDGVVFGGDIDRLADGHLTDFKDTKRFTYDHPESYFRAMQLYDFLLQSHGHKSTDMWLSMNLKDYTPSGHARHTDYPDSCLEPVMVPFDYDTTGDYLVRRIALYKEYRDAEVLPRCTVNVIKYHPANERWSDVEWVKTGEKDEKGKDIKEPRDIFRKCSFFCPVASICGDLDLEFDWRKALHECFVESQYKTLNDFVLHLVQEDGLCPDGLPVGRDNWVKIYNKITKENSHE